MKTVSVQLNVMLLKNDADFSQPESFINEYNKNKVIQFDSGDTEAILYHRKGKMAHPSWIRSFQKKIANVDLEGKIKKNQSHGVTLYLKVNNRVFALNWGISARFNTKSEAVDEKFGIYVANKILNSNQDVLIKSAQSRVNQTNPVNKIRQYGETISSDELMLTMEDNEAFKELNIKISSSADYQKMIGKYSSLSIQFKFKESELPIIGKIVSKLNGLLQVYSTVTTDDIKKLFKGIYPVTEKEEKALQVELVKNLTSTSTQFFLYEPDIDFDFSTVQSYKFTCDDEDADSTELSLANYLKARVKPSIEHLKNDEVSIVDEDGNVVKKWPIYKCIYGEIPFNNTNYIFSYGEWFEVSHDKYVRITKKIKSITQPKLALPSQVTSNTVTIITNQKNANTKAGKPKAKIDKERIFNNEWCTFLKAEFFDEISKQIKIYESQFEVCDIYQPQNKEFIHVKYNYGASSLSHLFNQGYVSSTSFAKFPDVYTVEVNKQIKNASHHIKTPHNGHTIHYVILNNKKNDELSFFSKMVLEDKITTLESMGFKVKLSWADCPY